MRMRRKSFLIFLFLLSVCQYSNATQDVEDPQHIIKYIRAVMAEPIIAAEVLRLALEGCTWENEVFWSGSPSEESLKTRIFWMNFSMQVATKSGNKFWKSYSFSSKDGGPILDIVETTKMDQVISCSE